MYEYCWNGGKRCYSKKDAQTQVNWIQNNRRRYNRKGHHLNIYECPYCWKWHITHEEQHA